jgi:hypothetical protein
MPSISQKITLDRLAAALEAQGVSLKRHQLLEVAARAFGNADAQHMTAAAKRGELDPPVAEDLGLIDAAAVAGAAPLRVLRDPGAGRLFAVEDAAFDPTVRADRFAVSPYGGLVALPALATALAGGREPTASIPHVIGDVPVLPRIDPATIRYFRPCAPFGQGRTEEYEPNPADRKRLEDLVASFSKPDVGRSPVVVAFVAESGSVPPAYEQYGHLLSDESFDVEAGPILYLTPRRLATMEGRTWIWFDFDEEYPDHEQATYLLRDLRAFKAEHGDRIERAGCRLDWTDVLDEGRVEVSLMVPVEIAKNIGPDRAHDFWDAIAALLGSGHAETVTAKFHPESWQNDWAVDADPEGETTFDVTFEVLTMGREEARRLEDNRDESDELRDAVHAPEWIRKWSGPFRVEIADAVREFLDDREANEPHECGQCEGTGTIEGGLSGNGDDEECPVCDGSGTLDA